MKMDDESGYEDLFNNAISPSDSISDSESVEMHPTSAKTEAIAALLKNIEAVNLIDVCTELEWDGSASDYPKQKHIKVAIVSTLIKVAKEHNWHLIHDRGSFYIYTGAFWATLEDTEVKQLLKCAAIKMSYAKIECLDSAFVDKLFLQAREDGFFVESNVSRQSMINLKNGSLVLNECGVTLKAFDYRDFLTHQLDFSYDPSAVNELFLTYLGEVLPDANTRKTLQQVAGYLFIKGLKMEKIILLFGLGANGKSVFYEVLNGVIGADNISNYSLESLTDSNGYYRAMIKDKILNYGTDVRMNRIDAGMFKTLASGEPIDARLPYGQPFVMADYAKFIFNVNRMDSANIEHTHGFYRRLLIIPFNNTIDDEKQDRDLHKKILANRAGVLNWIIEGANEVIRNRNIYTSDECENFRQEFIKETDSVAMFEDDIKSTMRGAIYSETVANSYRDYREFCIDAGNKPVGRNNFSKRMEAIGFTKTKKENGWCLGKNYSVERF